MLYKFVDIKSQPCHGEDQVDICMLYGYAIRNIHLGIDFVLSDNHKVQ